MKESKLLRRSSSSRSVRRGSVLGLRNRSLHYFPIHSPSLNPLRRGNRDQGAIGNGLHKPITQRVEGGA